MIDRIKFDNDFLQWASIFEGDPVVRQKHFIDGLKLVVETMFDVAEQAEAAAEHRHSELMAAVLAGNYGQEKCDEPG